MALWAFIPGKHIQAVGGLPQSARRLDTGELVNDLPGAGFVWTDACGWWDLDNIDVEALTRINHLTPADLTVLAQERDAALAARTQRRTFLTTAQTAWAAAKDTLTDYADGIPAPPQVGDPGFPTLNVALTEQQIVYLWHATQDQARILTGVADVVMTLAAALADLLDRADGLTLPT